MINWWVRGICQYGILPCNGLVYSPPDQCGCYIESKLADAQVIDVSKITPSGKVIFGSTVTLIDADSGDEIRVAGVDAQNRQGVFSVASDPYTPDPGAPGAPDMVKAVRSQSQEAPRRLS